MVLMSSSDTHTMRLNPEQRQQLLALARESIRHALQHDAPLRPALADYPPPLTEPAASFVTLNLNQQLRGCIGTLSAYQPLVIDVATNAYNAAMRDPRFPSLTAEELAQVKIHISVLSTPAPLFVDSEEDLLARLRPGIDGLIIRDGVYHATFLPSVWQSLPTAADFVSHLKHKAGLPAHYWSDTLEIETYQSESFGD